MHGGRGESSAFGCERPVRSAGNGLPPQRLSLPYAPAQGSARRSARTSEHQMSRRGFIEPHSPFLFRVSRRNPPGWTSQKEAALEAMVAGEIEMRKERICIAPLPPRLSVP